MTDGDEQALLFEATPEAPPVGDGSVTSEGQVVRVTFSNRETGFRVVRVKTLKGAEETWVGLMPELHEGVRVRASGAHVVDKKFGPQLKVSTCLVVAPATLEGLEKYLGSGVVRGVGPALAKRIVDTFGERTLHVLDKTPMRLREVQGLGRKKAEALEEAWAEQRAVSGIFVFLQGHGASPALANRIYKRFGPRAVEIVTKNPYRLALDVDGIGFKTADRIARSLGISADAPERAAAGLLHVLGEQAARGHVCLPIYALLDAASNLLGVDPARAEEALVGLREEGRVVAGRLGEATEVVYAKDLFEAEASVARRLARLARAAARPVGELDVAEAIAAIEARIGGALAPEQRDAVATVARESVVVITGGPGVGKTTIVRAVLEVLRKRKAKVLLAAPTGRAAKRVSETTGQEALTIHRLLEFDPRAYDFARCAENPLDGDAIVVDESSMLDVRLADALLAAIGKGTRLVLVGDVDQLPSVGPGAVLRDVIDSGVVPTVRLTRIYRQAEGSLIVENAHAIRDGRAPESAAGPSGEFYVLPRGSADAAADTVLEVVTKRIPDRFGLDPRRDVQVLSPMHRGAAGDVALNQRLQAALNPSGQEVSRGQRTLRIGDKVMQLKNDYQREVFNGDVGFVVAADAEARTLLVDFYGRGVTYTERDLDELTLAYATSIHKSQGSEYPAVVIPIATEHFVMLSRNLLYTAVTRGKRLVVLVADPRAIGVALGETRREERWTGLRDRLLAEAARPDED